MTLKSKDAAERAIAPKLFVSWIWSQTMMFVLENFSKSESLNIFFGLHSAPTYSLDLNFQFLLSFATLIIMFLWSASSTKSFIFFECKFVLNFT